VRVLKENIHLTIPPPAMPKHMSYKVYGDTQPFHSMPNHTPSKSKARGNELLPTPSQPDMLSISLSPAPLQACWDSHHQHEVLAV